MLTFILLLTLLPIAFVAGWLASRKTHLFWPKSKPIPISSDYFRGLNYLLNEEQDKAIEVLLRLTEDQQEAAETHLALGNLFRRRGEVDRAIHLHQHLVARKNIDEKTKTIALFELGEDYMRAGLLDRAEILFSDMVKMNLRSGAAHEYLVTIYQHESDWHKAIKHSQYLQDITGQSQRLAIAHYYCQLAEQSRDHGAAEEARQYLSKAFNNQKDNVRALMIKGQMLVDEGNHSAALIVFKQAIDAGTDCIPEILPLLMQSYYELDDLEDACQYLHKVLSHYQGISLVLALTNIYMKQDREPEAVEFLTAQLQKRPSVRGVMALLDITMTHAEGRLHQNFTILRDLAHSLVQGQANYRCEYCGFGARGHHWQCPGCKTWGSVHAIHGTANE